jgi:hypothetical protein
MSETPSDRRHFHRVIMHRPVHMDCPSGTHEGDLLDMSLKGALVAVQSDWRPQIDSEAELRLNLGNEGDEFLIKVQARVARVDDAHVGLQVTRMDLDSATRLRRLVELNLADPALLERELEELTSG